MKRLKFCFFLVILALALSLFGIAALAEGETETPPPPAEYELTLSGTEGFVIRYLDKTVTESVASIPAGTEVTVSLPPETGLKVKVWSATGADLESEEMKTERTEESIRFVMPAGPFLLSAECEARPKHTLTVRVTEDQKDLGTTWKEKGNEYFEGQSVTVKVFPHEGIAFEKWLVDGPRGFEMPEPVIEEGDTACTFTFPMPDGDLEINPVFRIIVYTLRIELDGEGTVEVEGAVPVEKEPPEEGGTPSEKEDGEEGTEEKEPEILEYQCVVGQKIHVTATAAEDYRFVRWSVTGLAELANPAQEDTDVICPATDFVITAHFSSSVHSLTVSSGDGGIATSEGTFPLGLESVFPLEAQPSAGYVFAGWECSSPQGRFEDPKASKTNFTMPDEDCTVTATFKKGSYTLKITASHGGSAEGESASYEMGKTVAVRAIPLEGYVFSRWEVEGASTAILADPNAAETTVTVPGRDCTVVAVFEISGNLGAPTATTPHSEEGSPFPWIPLLIIFVLSLTVIGLVILKEKSGVSLRYLLGKWLGGEE